MNLRKVFTTIMYNEIHETNPGKPLQEYNKKQFVLKHHLPFEFA